MEKGSGKGAFLGLTQHSDLKDSTPHLAQVYSGQEHGLLVGSVSTHSSQVIACMQGD